MLNIIFNLKNIVVLILASEFLKQLVLSKKYKSYINFAISMSIIGFIIALISGASFDISSQPDFNYFEPESSENLIIKEYKNKITEKISQSIPDASEIEVFIDNEYNITNLKIKVKEISADTAKILEELGFTDYEIMD